MTCIPLGGALTLHFGRYVPRESEKWGGGGSGASLSVTIGASRIDFKTRLAGTSGWPAANPGALPERVRVGCSKLAVGGMNVTTFWKRWSLRSVQNTKWWWSDAKKCSPFMKMEGKFRAGNGGLSRGTYLIYIYMEVPAPPPPAHIAILWYMICLLEFYEALFLRIRKITY